jgi:hypothetical protein
MKKCQKGGPAWFSAGHYQTGRFLDGWEITFLFVFIRGHPWF